MADLRFAYEEASATSGIDWVRIESQARSAGITDFRSAAYFDYAQQRYMPMLDSLMDRYLELYADVQTGNAETMTREETRDAVDEMESALDRSSAAIDAALAEGKRVLGFDEAPTVTAAALARYVNALGVLAVDGHYRQGLQMPGAVAAGAVTVEQALEDANNIAITLQALIELRRAGTLDIFVARNGASGVGAIVIGGVTISVGATVVIAIAVVLVAFLIAAALVAAFAMAHLARLIDKYCFDPETKKPYLVDGRPMPGCEELPGMLDNVYQAFLEPGKKLAEKIGWAVVVIGVVWAGSKFLLPALSEEIEKRRREPAPAV